jgi:hypothetical protein
MTEREWLGCADPMPMLGFLRGNASARKLRLFACACCRHVWDRLLTDWARDAVEASERFADGVTEWYEVEQMRPPLPPGELIRPYRQQQPGEKIGTRLTGSLGYSHTWEVAREVAWEASGLGFRKRERQFQATLLRCIVGNPFRPPPVIDSSWLSWNDGTVPRLAQAIYDERGFDHLPILADALEEAGCNNTDMLEHCRSEEAHNRGCWPLDLILGKE